MAVFRAIFASNREHGGETLVFNPEKVLRPIEHAPERLLVAPDAPPVRVHDDDEVESESEEDEPDGQVR